MVVIRKRLGLSGERALKLKEPPRGGSFNYDDLNLSRPGSRFNSLDDSSTVVCPRVYISSFTDEISPYSCTNLDSVGARSVGKDIVVVDKIGADRCSDVVQFSLLGGCVSGTHELDDIGHCHGCDDPQDGNDHQEFNQGKAFAALAEFL